MPQFAGDAFRHIKAQQHRPRRQPAHRLGKAARPIGGRRHCNQPARGQLRRFNAAQQRPKLRAQSHGARLQRFRHIKRIAPGTNANALQFLAKIGADFTIRPPQGQAQFLTQPKGRAAQRIILSGFFFRRKNRAQIALHQSLNPSGQPRADAFALRAIQELSGQYLNQRLTGFRARLELRHFRDIAKPCRHIGRMGIGPGHAMLRRQRKRLILRGFQHGNAARDFRPKRASRGAQHNAAFFFLYRRAIGFKQEALHMADRMAFHHHFPTPRDGGKQFLIAFIERANQMRRTAVHKARGQAFMQSVGDHVFHAPRFGLKLRRIIQPIGPRRDIGPDANGRKPRHQRIKITFRHAKLGKG